MSISIVKLNKIGLLQQGTERLYLNNSTELTISQYADVTKPYSYDLPFQISVAEKHAPQIQEEIVLVIREKVDFTARNPNDVTLKKIGKDLGGENSIDKKPYRPKDLPPGFEEVLHL